eukprot:9615866-Prorocentrum_lima.AAC.1
MVWRVTHEQLLRRLASYLLGPAGAHTREAEHSRHGPPDWEAPDGQRTVAPRREDDHNPLHATR